MFEQIKTIKVPDSGWGSKDRLGDSTFPRASDTPQLQAADLLVHLSYQMFLELHASNKDEIELSPLLAECMRNRQTKEDVGFQDKNCLESLINAAKLRGVMNL